MAANLGFILYLSDSTISDFLGAPSNPSLDTLFLFGTAVSIGFASYLLKESKGRSGLVEIAQFLKVPPRAFSLFLLTSTIWAAGAAIGQPFTVNSLNTNGEAIYYVSYQDWFLVVSATLLTAFILLPVLSFYRQSRRVQDPKAAGSIRLISVCWGLFGLCTFFQEAVTGAYAGLVKSAVSLADGALFVLVSFALREPTILSRIVSGGETIIQAISSDVDEDTIVLYNTESDRRRLVERFVEDGTAIRQDLVFFVTKSEVPFYKALLREERSGFGDNDELHLFVQPLDFGSSEGLTTPGSQRAKRELVDLGELSLDQCKQVISKVRSLDALPGPNRVPRIWALNVEEAESGTLEAIREANPAARIRDLALQQDSFSKLFSTKHSSLPGNRILLEYDPVCNFESVVQRFAKEFQANVEPIAIFTSMGSPMFNRLREQRSLRLFTFSAKTSTPSKVTDEHVLLPERDTSLLLDAVDKLLQSNRGRLIGLVFDVFTDLILVHGFEKAYGILSSVVEMTESESAMALVLINYAALEERSLNGIRGLFRIQAKFDSEGFKVIRSTNTTSQSGERERFGLVVGVQDSRGGVRVE